MPAIYVGGWFVMTGHSQLLFFSRIRLVNNKECYAQNFSVVDDGRSKDLFLHARFLIQYNSKIYAVNNAYRCAYPVGFHLRSCRG